MIWALVSIALARAACAVTGSQQNDGSLAAYFQHHPWDIASRGPMLVLDPASVTPSSSSNGLKAFGRKEFNLTTLTVVAPTEMVFIDASLKDPANMYDGLPRSDKIVYLMTTLDADQWKAASSSGIGLGDLRPDQRLIFRSILPSVFTYENNVAGKGNRLLPNPNGPPEVTLSSDEEAGVRLHFFDQVELGVKMQEGGFSAVSTQLGSPRKEGQPMLHRSNNAGEDRTTLFGVQIRKVQENRLKPSDLNYKSKALDGRLALSAKATIAELCKSAEIACGIKLIADTRIGDMTMTAYGDSARIGDVLQALALSVAGTFRRVGDRYILTCDLEGIGAKRLKIATWKAGLELLTRKRVSEWKRNIRSSGGARRIGLQPECQQLINEPVTKFLEDDHEDNGAKTMPASELPPEWQSALKAGSMHFGNRQVRTDVVFPYEEVLWNFVLPDGKPLEWEESLGHRSGLTREPGPIRDYASKSVVKPIPLRAGSSTAIMFKTNDPSVAGALPVYAASHGFEEIWLQTWQSRCLLAVIAAANSVHIRVRLVVRPWEIPDGMKASDLDKNILDGTSIQAEDSFEGSAEWEDSSPIWGVPPVNVGLNVSPNSQSNIELRPQLVDLSKTDGLAGSVLVDTEPPGYEPDATQFYFGTSNSLLELGYSESLRGRFIEENQVDPIDIVDQRLLSNERKLDLSLPYFGDPVRTATDQPRGSLKAWAKLRADVNHRSTLELASQLAGPVFVQVRHNFRGSISLGGVQVLPWLDKAELPSVGELDSLEQEAESVPVDGYCLWQFGRPTEPALLSRLYDALNRHLARAKGSLAVDMSSIPPTQLSKILDQWFKKG